MKGYFDVSGEDIAALSDGDLRTLVGKLCEADYRKAGLPVKGIVWGGNQDAVDGGFDVVVDDDVQPPNESFILRSFTGFQVKKPSMSASKINAEMAPKGKLRNSIKALILKKGAYVIVSSGDSCPRETGLKDRLKSMREVIVNEDVEVDFLDRDRLATWANCHPGIVLWVLMKIGRGVSGWRPYGNWSNAPGGIVEEYLISDDACIKREYEKDGESLSSINAINCLRLALRSAKSSVRLVGLSGVGKTRLVQALFDDRVGEDTLNQDLVMYTDIANDPDPDPKHLLSQLIAKSYEGIVVVDNCSRELHANLTNVCREDRSKLSLLTVEYDVREHLPEETAVYRMEPTSADLIEKVLVKQFINLGDVNARKIAECSGGNYRVAISIAKTVNKGESLATLKDTSIFDRLFRQTNEVESALLQSAEALSLLYSFDSDNASDSSSELSFLGRFVDLTGLKMYEHAATIETRQLLQSRGQWRAILPHAVANHLASNFLVKKPPSYVWEQVLGTGSERMIKSFTRRLGYLHQNKQAVEIVELLLKADGWIGKSIGNLNALGMQVLKNIAPVSTDGVLAALERVADECLGKGEALSNHSNAQDFGTILFHLAYEDRLYTQSVTLLFECSIKKDNANNMGSPIAKLIGLFRYSLSGSQAKLETRVESLKTFMYRSEADEKDLSMKLLSASLETGGFVGMSDYDFGSRSRDLGYSPKTYEELRGWFVSFLQLGVTYVTDGLDDARQVRSVIADSFRGLWRIGCYRELTEIAEKILKYGHWLEGWCAVRSVMAYDWDKQNEETKVLLKKLNELLKPRDIKDQVEVYISGGRRINFDPEYDDPDEKDYGKIYEKLGVLAVLLGEKVGDDSKFLKKIAPDLVTGYNERAADFGKGLAKSKGDFDVIWNLMRDAYILVDQNERNAAVLGGMLKGLHDRSKVSFRKMLGELESDGEMVQFLPSFQSYGGYDDDKLRRLYRLLDDESIPIWNFKSLSCGRRHSSISDHDYVEILRKLEKREEGMHAVLDMLSMRFLDVKKGVYEPSKVILDFSVELLLNFDLKKEYGHNSSIDHELSSVAKIVFSEKGRESDAQSFCHKLTGIFSEYGYCSNSYVDVFTVMLEAQPLAFLNGWLDSCSQSMILKAFDRFDRHSSENLLGKVDKCILDKWLSENPVERYPKVACIVKMFETKENHWNEIAVEILEKSSVPDEVLKVFVRRMYPRSWSGSLVNILEANLKFLKELKEKNISQVILNSHIAKFEEIISEERKCERKESRGQYLSFE